MTLPRQRSTVLCVADRNRVARISGIGTAGGIRSIVRPACLFVITCQVIVSSDLHAVLNEHSLVGTDPNVRLVGHAEVGALRATWRVQRLCQVKAGVLRKDALSDELLEHCSSHGRRDRPDVAVIVGVDAPDVREMMIGAALPVQRVAERLRHPSGVGDKRSNVRVVKRLFDALYSRTVGACPAPSLPLDADRNALLLLGLESRRLKLHLGGHSDQHDEADAQGVHHHGLAVAQTVSDQVLQRELPHVRTLPEEPHKDSQLLEERLEVQCQANEPGQHPDENPQEDIEEQLEIE
mmetsp:Transcript_101376/g.246520  ORF Transcript_101376/g.246520 Transcript_101376/m.246520 type:complete len:294 (+) Transcript_101376:761-1642(+)